MHLSTVSEGQHFKIMERTALLGFVYIGYTFLGFFNSTEFITEFFRQPQAIAE